MQQVLASGNDAVVVICFLPKMHRLVSTYLSSLQLAPVLSLDSPKLAKAKGSYIVVARANERPKRRVQSNHVVLVDSSHVFKRDRTAIDNILLSYHANTRVYRLFTAHSVSARLFERELLALQIESFAPPRDGVDLRALTASAAFDVLQYGAEPSISEELEEGSDEVLSAPALLDNVYVSYSTPCHSSMILTALARELTLHAAPYRTK